MRDDAAKSVNVGSSSFEFRALKTDSMDFPGQVSLVVTHFGLTLFLQPVQGPSYLKSREGLTNVVVFREFLVELYLLLAPE